MEPHRLALPVGFQIEHFRIEAVLGKGGFGITYLALDLQLGKRVAIKELLPDTIATRVEGLTVVPHSAGMQENWEWARERFLEEARTLATFSHPAIVGVHRLIEANGTVYMVMDYVEGESYEARLQRIGTEPDQASLMAVIGPILSGLEEVHAHGLLHRDIKPENILIDKRGQPVLIDFGSARESVGKTMTMTSIVTHGYSPIEQYQTKGRMGPWTDIYAIAAVMCRAIAGEKPPVASDRVILEVYGGLVPSGSGYNHSFCAAIDWALRVKPEERPQSIGQWKEVLNGATEKAVTPVEGGIAYKSAFKAQCPVCFQRVELESSMHGKAVECPNCKETYNVSEHTCVAAQLSQSPASPRRKERLWPAFATATVLLTLMTVLFMMSRRPAPQDMTTEARNLLEKDAQPESVVRAIELLEEAAGQGDATAQTMLGDLYSTDGRAGVSKDLAAAISWYTKAANQNIPEAQFKLGAIHFTGRGVLDADHIEFHWWENNSVPVDDAGAVKGAAEAVKWWRKAAENGYAPAQNAMGMVHSKGIEVAKDPAEAVRWHKMAAEQGLAQSQWMLGLALLQGNGAREDRKEGRRWIRTAAEGGSAPAQISTGYTYHHGIEEEQDHSEAVRWWKKAAAQSSAVAQRLLGIAYSLGWGVAEDPAEAYTWFTKAAEQNDGEAQGWLGSVYASGEGVELDHKKAFEWFEKAARNGDKMGQFHLGMAYSTGAGVERSDKDAVFWWTKAAEQGQALAQARLAFAYWLGEGVSVDKAKAAEWASKPAQKGDKLAQYLLGSAYFEGNGIEMDRAKAVEWWRKSAEQGMADAQAQLGSAYASGAGIEKDSEKAVEWWSKAAAQGNADAQTRLAAAYSAGIGVAQDLGRAAALWEQAAEQGVHQAQYFFGHALFHGIGVAQDKNKATEWLTKAAEQGDPAAQTMLGAAYVLGEGVEKNEEESVKWFTKAARQGNAEGQCRLGIAYAYGQGVKQNPNSALEWLTKAAEQDNEKAIIALGIGYNGSFGVAKDSYASVRWFKKAAQKGSPVGQYFLGVAYALGQGTERDRAEARRWFTKAAEQGHDGAKDALRDLP